MGSQGTILLAEDDPNDVFLVERALREAGITNPLAVARDGREAVEYLGRPPELNPTANPFLVLLDLDMPEMNGFEVLSWLRRRPRFAKLPVVVFTGSSLSPDVARAYRLGANSFLIKPSNLDQLKSALKEIIQFWAGNPAPDQVPSTPPFVPPEPPQSERI